MPCAFSFWEALNCSINPGNPSLIGFKEKYPGRRLSGEWAVLQLFRARAAKQLIAGVLTTLLPGSAFTNRVGSGDSLCWHIRLLDSDVLRQKKETSSLVKEKFHSKCELLYHCCRQPGDLLRWEQMAFLM